MQPLTGIKILDVSRLLPGPWATMLLADLGAEVIKVEDAGAGGDGSRHAFPRYHGNGTSESVYFCTVNRNKRSVTLDLKSEEGRKLFHELVRDADVVVESLRMGSADRLGIGYDALKQIKPTLVYCSLTGYGQTGPLSVMAGHDLNIVGMTGMLQRDAAERPEMPTGFLGDYAGGTMIVVGVLSALMDRERHGRGAHIDVSMLDASISWTSVHVSKPFAAKVSHEPQRAMEAWGNNPRYGIYETRDGRYVTVSLLEKKYWEAFCRYNGRPDLVSDDETGADRLTTHGDRGPVYRAFIAETIRSKDRDTWTAEMESARIPIAPVLTPAEVMDLPQAAAREQFVEVHSDDLGLDLPQIGFPFRMVSSDGTNAFAIRRAPPALGEGNDELLPRLSEGE